MESCNSMLNFSGRVVKENRKSCCIIYKKIQYLWLLELLLAAAVFDISFVCVELGLKTFQSLSYL